MKPSLLSRLRYVWLPNLNALIERLSLAVRCGVLSPEEALASYHNETRILPEWWGRLTDPLEDGELLQIFVLDMRIGQLDRWITPHQENP